MGRGDRRRGRPRPGRRSRSSAGRTSASRACSTRCSARTGRSCPTSPARPATRSTRRLAWGRSEIVLIDTAGIKRRGKVAVGPGRREATRRCARCKAIGRADVAVLVIDAVEGLTAQDAHIAGYVVEEGKGLVIAVNKWDLVEEKTDQTFDQYVEWIRHEVPFLDFAPVVSISAKTGQRVGRVLELAVDIWGERRKRISTGELNRRRRARRSSGRRRRSSRAAGRRSSTRRRRPSRRRRSCSSPTTPGSVHFSYRRYLENRLREAFGFDGTPIRLVFRDRSARRSCRAARSRSPRAAARGGSAVDGRPERRRAHRRAGHRHAGGQDGDQDARRRRRSRPEGRRRSRPDRGARPTADRERRNRDRRERRADRATRARRASPSSARAPGARRSPSCSGAASRSRCWCRTAESAARLAAERRNEQRLPGVDLLAGRPRRPPIRRRSRQADLVIVAVPSAYLREVDGAASAPSIRPVADVLSVVKGLERGTLLRMSEVIAEAARHRPRPDRRAVGPEPRPRDRPRAAGVGRRRRAGRSGARASGSVARSARARSGST